MIALKIEDLKTFTAQLFMGETFDHWLVREVNIVTFNSFRKASRLRCSSRRRRMKHSFAG